MCRAGSFFRMTRTRRSFLGSSRDIADRKWPNRKCKTQWIAELLARFTRAIGERQDLRSIFKVVIGSLEDACHDSDSLLVYPHARKSS